MKVFIDSDAILDFLLLRKPYFRDVSKLLLLSRENSIKIYTSAIIISNIYYITRQHYPKQIIIQKLKELTSIISIVDSTKLSIVNGFNSDFIDFEDAIQYYTALENKCTFLITRNVKDYTKAKNIRVLTPSQFCKLFVK
jgi:predicted nucleic acid-binding protein